MATKACRATRRALAERGKAEGGKEAEGARRNSSKLFSGALPLVGVLSSKGRCHEQNCKTFLKYFSDRWKVNIAALMKS